VDDARLLGALEAAQRALVLAGNHVEHLGILEPARSLLAAPAIVVDRVIARDRTHPGPEGPVRLAITIQALEHLHEDVLRQVLRLVHPAHEAISDSEHAAGVKGHQLAPGCLVPLPAPSDEIGDVVGQRWRRLEWGRPITKP
jgi:hypothetical protein